MAVAVAPRRASRDQVGLSHVDQRRKLAVEQGDIDVLSCAGQLAMVQRSQDGDSGVHTGHDVGEGHAHLARRPLYRTGDRHQAALSLDGKVVTRPAGQWSRLAVARDGAVDEAGVEFAQRFKADAHLPGLPRPEVLDHHVRPGGEPADDGNALGSLEVDGERTLVAVDRQVVGALAAGIGRTPLPRIIPLTRRFHLDHFGAVIGKHHRAVRPCQYA